MLLGEGLVLKLPISSSSFPFLALVFCSVLVLEQTDQAPVVSPRLD